MLSRFLLEQQQTTRYHDIRRISLIGAAINVLLVVAQIIFGILGHSQALVADGFHTLSDLISDVVVLVAAKYASQVADQEHPYGHRRFETVATIVVGGLLLIVALGIFLVAGQRLLQPSLLLPPTILSLSVVIITICLKEMLYHLAMKVAKKHHSDMLKASAWHHRSDAISSVIVLIGIAGSMAGLPWLDAVAAIGVSLMIARIGWLLGRGGVRELVDTSLDREKVLAIQELIKSIDGVRTLHELRTRQMGSQALVDVHLLVNPRITVSEGHQIGEAVRTHLIDKMEEIVDVVVHIDPENDENSSPNLKLPLRKELIAHLHQYWQHLEAARSIKRINLHYLAGKVTVEIYLPLSIIKTSDEALLLSQSFEKLVATESNIYAIKVYYG